MNPLRTVFKFFIFRNFIKLKKGCRYLDKSGEELLATQDVRGLIYPFTLRTSEGIVCFYTEYGISSEEPKYNIARRIKG